jgi:nucleotide-binding universal stress UspA family protein
MYKHILVPTDGSIRSERAVSAGLGLAKALGTKVTGLYVTDPTYVREIDDVVNVHADDVLADFSRQAMLAGVAHDCVAIRGSSPQNGIMNFASEKGCDLIVMGTHGRSRVGKFLLGSVAASLIADCDVPVLLYR